MNIIKGKLNRAQRVILYGPEGVGKSTLAAAFPHPLVLDTEDGSHHLDVDRVPVARLADIVQAIAEVQQMQAAGTCAYESLVIDTADALWRMCAEQVCLDNNWKNIEQPGYGKGYAIASARFTGLFRSLDQLMRGGMHVVIVCHMKVVKVNLPDAPEFSRYCLKVSAPTSQAETAREFLKEWCDALIFCTIRNEVDGLKGKAVRANERVAFCTSNPHCESKNRLGLPPEVPLTPEALSALWGGAPAAAPAAPASAAEFSSPAVAPDFAASPAASPAGARAADLSAVPASAVPADGGCREKMEAPEGGAFTAEEHALLLGYFRGMGKLAVGQGLDALPVMIRRALKARPAAALAKAREYVGSQSSMVR